ncbi:HNH endonuclease family protein [Lactobacillus sp. ESL0701]|uniref:HNH endonuclease family protein n=1 Tax=Lactobacillus sp. ESL0701 TaxID=2983217 RepID=UPI0023F79471|nr:HNH endonuclease family protein [Lactobacillus sp. ESL0701]MDF7672285.1 HNH endonuclease family protein [Lactobacillus sp. ESL0701]
MTTNLYKLRNNMAKLTLVMLEESRTKEVIDFDDAQVEHIMPQHLTTDWRLQVTNADRVNEQYGGSLGNLTLTKYNQEMSNRTFSEKKEFYRDSNINLTREVAQSYSMWDETAITTRAKTLIVELLRIFPEPKIYSEKQTELILAGEYNIADGINITGRKPASLTINGVSYPVTSWRAALITLLNYLWDEDSRNLTQIKQEPSLQKKLFSSLRSPSVLKNGLKIETNYSARDILAIMTKVAEVSGITDQVGYTIK